MTTDPTPDLQRVLIVEDEPKLANLLSDYLINAGFSTRIIFDGALVLSHLSTHGADLVLLDVNLPSVDGFQLCRSIRRTGNIPIILVTARVDELDRLTGLELGADDYVCKPFSPREVVARVRALLRRTHSALSGSATSVKGHGLAATPSPASTAASSLPNHILLPALLELDEQNQQAHYLGVAIDLTTVEFRLLRALIAASGKVLSRPQLMFGLYQDHRVVSERTVDSHIKNLRKKFTDRGLLDPIVAVYGLGYKLKQGE